MNSVSLVASALRSLVNARLSKAGITTRKSSQNPRLNMALKALLRRKAFTSRRTTNHQAVYDRVISNHHPIDAMDECVTPHHPNATPDISTTNDAVTANQKSNL